MTSSAQPAAGPSLDGPVAVGGARAWMSTTRLGNLGMHVGDDARAVGARREALARAVGAPIWFASQVHGTTVLDADRPADGAHASLGEGDAIVLDARGRAPGEGPVAAAVMVADCSPLVLASADGRLAAVVHAGRAGLLAGVVEAAVGALVGRDRSLGRPGALHALLGPGICGGCYEVSEEIARDAAGILPAASVTTRRGAPGVDVGAGVRQVLAEDPTGRLRAAGAEPGGVRLCDTHARCTYEAADLYSYRRATHEVAALRARGEDVGYEGPARTGRFVAVVRTAP